MYPLSSLQHCLQSANNQNIIHRDDINVLDVCKKKNKVLAVINLDEDDDDNSNETCNNKRCNILTQDNSNINISSGANFKIKKEKGIDIKEEGLEINKEIYLVPLIGAKTDIESCIEGNVKNNNTILQPSIPKPKSKIKINIKSKFKFINDERDVKTKKVISTPKELPFSDEYKVEHKVQNSSFTQTDLLVKEAATSSLCSIM